MDVQSQRKVLLISNNDPCHALVPYGPACISTADQMKSGSEEEIHCV